MQRSYIFYPDELYHHGIKGQKWGVRRTAEQLGHKLTKTRKINSEFPKHLEAAREHFEKAKALSQQTKDEVFSAYGKSPQKEKEKYQKLADIFYEDWHKDSEAGTIYDKKSVEVALWALNNEKFDKEKFLKNVSSVNEETMAMYGEMFAIPIRESKKAKAAHDELYKEVSTSIEDPRKSASESLNTMAMILDDNPSQYLGEVLERTFAKAGK